MLDFLTNQQHFKVLENALNVSSLRHKVISNNIANIDTPNFKRSEVVFEEHLKNYLEHIEKRGVISLDQNMPLALTNKRHIGMLGVEDGKPFLGATVRTVDEWTMRTDGNNVDIDEEMANMAKNTIYYQAVSQRINGYFSTLRSVIENR